jgi:hypothetical protein
MTAEFPKNWLMTAGVSGKPVSRRQRFPEKLARDVTGFWKTGSQRLRFPGKMARCNRSLRKIGS